jgi:hypothetical protein
VLNRLKNTFAGRQAIVKFLLRRLSPNLSRRVKAHNVTFPNSTIKIDTTSKYPNLSRRVKAPNVTFPNSTIKIDSKYLLSIKEHT